jgi:hypothetical protein
MTERRFEPSHEIHHSGQVAGGSTVVLRWCSHPHGPLPRQIAERVIGGGATLLQCEGDLARCQVPEDRR